MHQVALKPGLLELLKRGQARQQVFIDQLGDTERMAIGAADAWSGKDHLAHSAYAIAGTAQLIRAVARGETPEPDWEDPELNQRVFTDRQHHSWDEVLAELNRANDALRTAIEGCSEANLSDTSLIPPSTGFPVWCRIYVTGYEHPAEHYGQFYMERGDVQRARAIRRETIENALRFTGDREPYGYMLYNFGCFYAATGDPALALPAIREALELIPGLREWSREDPELAALQGHPDFQALVDDPSGGVISAN